MFYFVLVLSNHKLSDRGGELRVGQPKNIVDSTESLDTKPEQTNLEQNQDSFNLGLTVAVGRSQRAKV